ncbi:hypothetical protein PTTG_00650 [Puccinia triticina 1-1 BBBD Race 1]|uniref:Retrotransposon gag domain-containing protein n=1 Tax=Puccinia triticina (isolate 1-1 / race 1 (BBBD)) TaxID=630390 RepID=A0A0C4EIT3_PUCT1|nr:hypothetical protein PTTG_00650 [Puccinia triticina 1-1 BBBD Race 1]
MSTRRTTSSNNLLPITNPEALLRAANRAKQAAAAAEKQKQDAPHNSSRPLTTASSQPLLAAQPIPITAPLEVHLCPPSLSESLILPQAVGLPSSPATSLFSANNNIPPVVTAWSPVDPGSIKAPPQPTGTFNPSLSTPPALPAPAKLPPLTTTTQTPASTDGPVYTGPYQETEPFLNWIYGLDIFFDTKKVVSNDDKVRIVGTLIKETNLLSFYSNKAKSYLTKPWKDFKEALFEVALPIRWQQGLKTKICNLKMEKGEMFSQFESRPQTLQRMINYKSDPLIISDISLAKWMTLGLPDDLQADVQKFKLLEPYRNK